MKKRILFLVIAFVLSLSTFAQSQAERVRHFNLTNNVAIQGYDPVAYFIQKKAVKGSKDVAYSHLGVTYRFASETNKAAFIGNPSHYEPQYGGWCAFAMGDYGEKVEVDPKTFKVVNGKLYLFYNKFLNNTLKNWNMDEAALKKKADANWNKIIH